MILLIKSKQIIKWKNFEKTLKKVLKTVYIVCTFPLIMRAYLSLRWHYVISDFRKKTSRNFFVQC